MTTDAELNENVNAVTKTGDFIHMAFCVDGSTEFKKYIEIEGLTGMLYEIDDKKRGRFYIGMFKDKP